MNLDVSGSSSSPEVLSVSMLDQVYRLPPLPPTSLTLDDSMSGDQRVFPVRTPAVGPIQTSAQALEARGLFFFFRSCRRGWIFSLSHIHPDATAQVDSPSVASMGPYSLETWLATRVFPVKSGAVGLTTN